MGRGSPVGQGDEGILGVMGLPDWLAAGCPADGATGWTRGVQDKIDSQDAGCGIATPSSLPHPPYPCSIDMSTPINAASHKTPVAIACTKNPVSRFSTASA